MNNPSGAAAFRGHSAAFLTILTLGNNLHRYQGSSRAHAAHRDSLLALCPGLPCPVARCKARRYLALWLVARRALRVPLWQEKYFALAGFFGIFLYYLLENVALSYTFASNVGVMVVVAPLFTAILSRLFGQDKKRLGAGFFAGFVLAMAGIALISFNGTRFELSPKGDILAVLAALSWAFYSLLVRKIGEFGHPSIEATRRTFFYGLLFMLPALWFFDASPLPAGLANPICLANIAFLGLGASAMCFVSWNFSIRVLGTLQTSVYIYLVPVVTVLTSHVLLDEPLTLMICVGTVLTLTGLVLSSLDTLREAYRYSRRKRG